MTTLPRTIGPYRLEHKLGAGGMGVVYRAVDTSLDRVVAIKMMHARELMGDDVDLDEVQTRFLREARAAARIKSRHVAQVLQLGTTDEGEAYIVMELLHGTALSRVMSKQGALAPTRVVHIASQICRGMQSAHDLGVVHRDLKPANVMLVEEEGDHDVVKILDFGVAKLTDDNGAQGLTQTGALLGTLPFMAPEQIGGGTVDARTDIYALGILLYRMFTGMSVWDADSLGDIVRHQLSSTPPSMFERVTNAKFTPALDAVVLKCLAKDPAHRYQSMQLLRVALDEALHAAKNPALARTFNDADDSGDDVDDRVDTVEVVQGQGGRVRSVAANESREHGTSPTGNIPKDRLDKDGLPRPIASNDSGGIDVFRDDTLVASATAAAVLSSSSNASSNASSTNASSLTVPSRPKQPLPIDPRLLGPDEDSVVDGVRVDPQAPTLSRLEERPAARPSPGLITAPDRLFPSVGAGPVAVTSSALPASFGGPTTARAPSSRSFTRGPITPVKKGPIAAGAVVLFALLGIGLWQATTSTKEAPTTVIAPLPPVEIAPPAPPAPPAVVETKAVEPVPVAEPPAVEVVEVVEPAPIEPEPAKKPAPSTPTAAKKPATTTTKPAADDGFVRVRTKDGG